MADTSGAFVAIESPLESYAASHASRLRSRLEAAGYEVVYFTFPQVGEPSSYFAERYAKGSYGLANDVIPYAGSLFYALDHFEAGEAIRQAIADGKIVIAHKYLGSNMVEQGAKLNHPQERRGYFLWLDNLEARVLNTPRPDKTFVLSLSPLHAQSFDGEKRQALSVEKQIPLYSELCDLYPKDFIRVDGERNGKQLDDTMMQEMLWRLIEPLLPIKEVVPEPVIVPDLTLEKLEALLPTFSLTAKMTRLLATEVMQATSASYSLKIPDYTLAGDHFLVPEYYDKDLQNSYKKSLGKIFEHYKTIHQKLTTSHPKQADSMAASVLPLSAIVYLTLQLNVAQLRALLIQLLGHEQPEAWALGQEILKLSQKQSPTVDINAANIAYQASRIRAMRKRATKLPQSYATAESDGAQLIRHTPRNELDLVPDALYNQVSGTYEQLAKEVGSWPFEQKQACLEEYIGNRASTDLQLGSALKAARYEWDVTASYQTFSAIPFAVCNQHLTPRFGYTITDEVEAAGLSDAFEDCFDLSMQLYSELQQAGYELEAQHVTLMGHRQRFLLQTDAVQLSIILPKLPKIVTADIEQKISEVHPTIASALTPKKPEAEPAVSKPTKPKTTKKSSKKK